MAEKLKRGLQVAGLVVVAVLVTAVLAKPVGCEIDWNAAGTWAGALMTATAAGIALWIAIRDGRERDRARRDDEVAQARSLTATVSELDWKTALVTITNHSAAPVLAVEVERLHISPLADGPDWRQKIHNGSKVVLAPGTSFEVAVDVLQPTGERWRMHAPYVTTAVVRYRDSAGRAWTRWGNSDPQRELNATTTARKAPEQGYTIEHVGPIGSESSEDE